MRRPPRGTVDSRRRPSAFCGTLDGVTHRPRLLLRPGVHVLRRSADRFQLGLDPARAVVLPDTGTTRAALAALRSPGTARPEKYDDRTVDLLTTAGLVVDSGVLLPLLPTGPGPGTGLSRSDAAALAASDGDAVGSLVAARAGATVGVAHAGGTGAAEAAGTLTALLGAAGVTCTARGGTAPIRAVRGRSAPTRSAPSTVEVLVAVGEPARELLDGWVRDGTPHLLLRLVEGHVVVGPFVRPGETACLRCLDAHHTDLDPAWPLLVAQYATAVGRDREDAVPEPVDSVLATLGAAWAAREVLSAAEGRIPATTSTTVRLDPHLTRIETQDWPRHPGCGCGGL